jgi:hypothetical protein
LLAPVVQTDKETSLNEAVTGVLDPRPGESRPMVEDTAIAALNTLGHLVNADVVAFLPEPIGTTGNVEKYLQLATG